MAQSFTGSRGVSTFQAVALKNSLLMYHRHGMKPNRMWTPSSMMKLACAITGKAFKPRDYLGAANALEAWLKVNGGSSGELPSKEARKETND